MFDQSIMKCVCCCRQIGYDLLQLLHFVELNATGIRKILKKFDKRVGFRLGHQYIASRANHPYSQLQQVFRQVVCLPRLYSLLFLLFIDVYRLLLLFLTGIKPNSVFVCGLQGLGAMVATISRNLAELRREGLDTVSTSSTISLFRNSSLPRRIVEQEPVIQVILSLLVH